MWAKFRELEHWETGLFVYLQDKFLFLKYFCSEWRAFMKKKINLVFTLK